MICMQKTKNLDKGTTNRKLPQIRSDSHDDCVFVKSLAVGGGVILASIIFAGYTSTDNGPLIEIMGTVAGFGSAAILTTLGCK